MSRLSGRVDLRRSALAGAFAVALLAVVPYAGGVQAGRVSLRVVALAAVAGFAVVGLIAVRSAANELGVVTALRGGPAAAGAVRLVVTLAGYLAVGATVLGLLGVPVQRLLLSGAITGVVLGIAGQQSLANMFAGVVLLFTRPFVVGDWIVVHSGALGGSYEGRVEAVGLTFTRLATEEGPLHLPNSGVVAAATGPRAKPQAEDPDVGSG